MDPDAAAAYQRRQDSRAAGMRDLARRLHQQGKLRPRLTANEAAAVLWVLTSFETFDQLYSGWHLDAESCGSQIVALARAALLR